MRTILMMLNHLWQHHHRRRDTGVASSHVRIGGIEMMLQIETRVVSGLLGRWWRRRHLMMMVVYWRLNGRLVSRLRLRLRRATVATAATARSTNVLVAISTTA